MSLVVKFDLNCHVRPGADAKVTVTADGNEWVFNLTPTLDWVPSSTVEGSSKVSFDLDLNVVSNSTEFDMKIKAENSDVLVCGYNASKGVFQIVGQPVWTGPKSASWQPYDEFGHNADGAEFEGNGSLQILAGQTVELVGALRLGVGKVISLNQNG